MHRSAVPVHLRGHQGSVPGWIAGQGDRPVRRSGARRAAADCDGVGPAAPDLRQGTEAQRLSCVAKMGVPAGGSSARIAHPARGPVSSLRSEASAPRRRPRRGRRRVRFPRARARSGPPPRAGPCGARPAKPLPRETDRGRAYTGMITRYQLAQAVDPAEGHVDGDRRRRRGPGAGRARLSRPARPAGPATSSRARSRGNLQGRA